MSSNNTIQQESRFHKNVCKYVQRHRHNNISACCRQTSVLTKSLRLTWKRLDIVFGVLAVTRKSHGVKSVNDRSGELYSWGNRYFRFAAVLQLNNGLWANDANTLFVCGLFKYHFIKVSVGLAEHSCFVNLGDYKSNKITTNQIKFWLSVPE